MKPKNIALRILSYFPYNTKRKAFLLWAKLSAQGAVSEEGERWVVKSWDDLIQTQEYFHLLHAYRYYWAAPQTENLSVIDLGCGSGYGTFYLSQFAKEVVGLDSSPKAIWWARKYFRGKNIRFVLADALNPKLHQSFDTVVCLELLEHIRKENHQNLLGTTATLSRKLIMCTPNADLNSLRVKELQMVGRYNKDKFHPGELQSREFIKLLSQFYATIDICGQNIKNVATLDDWISIKHKPLTLNSFEMGDFNYASTNIFVVCENPVRGTI